MAESPRIRLILDSELSMLSFLGFETLQHQASSLWVDPALIGLERRGRVSRQSRCANL